LTVVGAVKEIDLILEKRDVGLRDLLLMFLYVEVPGTAGIYSDSKQIPRTVPIFNHRAGADGDPAERAGPSISFTKRARSCFSSIAAFIVNARPSNLTPRITKQGEKLVRPAGSSAHLVRAKTGLHADKAY
jgi:hypothetical protein